MNCNDIDRALSEEPRLPVEALDHVKGCRRCQELVQSLDSAVPADLPSAAVLRQIAQSIATDLRPVRPMAPARYFLGALLGIFACIVAAGAYGMGALAIAAMTPLQTTAILSALGVSAVLLAYSLVNQMAPGSRHRFAPGLLPLGIALCLAIAMAVLFQFKDEPNFWGHAWPCMRVGALFGVLAAVPIWMTLRRGAILTPAMSGAASGLFAGLVGTSVLEIHCPNLDAWHILVSHLGVAILFAVAGFLIGLAAELEVKATPRTQVENRKET
jgi:hypothetical protein